MKYLLPILMFSLISCDKQEALNHFPPPALQNLKNIDIDRDGDGLIGQEDRHPHFADLPNITPEGQAKLTLNIGDHVLLGVNISPQSKESYLRRKTLRSIFLNANGNSSQIHMPNYKDFSLTPIANLSFKDKVRLSQLIDENPDEEIEISLEHIGRSESLRETSNTRLKLYLNTRDDEFKDLDIINDSYRHSSEVDIKLNDQDLKKEITYPGAKLFAAVENYEVSRHGINNEQELINNIKKNCFELIISTQYGTKHYFMPSGKTLAQSLMTIDNGLKLSPTGKIAEYMNLSTKIMDSNLHLENLRFMNGPFWSATAPLNTKTKVGMRYIVSHQTGREIHQALLQEKILGTFKLKEGVNRIFNDFKAEEIEILITGGQRIYPNFRVDKRRQRCKFGHRIGPCDIDWKTYTEETAPVSITDQDEMLKLTDQSGQEVINADENINVMAGKVLSFRIPTHMKSLSLLVPMEDRYMTTVGPLSVFDISSVKHQILEETNDDYGRPLTTFQNEIPSLFKKEIDIIIVGKFLE